MQRWRVVLMGLVSLFLLVSGANAQVQTSLVESQEAMEKTVAGTVFEDRNGNGYRDPGEPGVADAIVSNQRQVVRTDRSGRFRLEVRPGQAIYVHQPSDYRVPVDHLNRPQFSWVYEPEGSPEMAYPGLEPTGEPPQEGLYFPLRAVQPTHSVKALVFGDPQPKDHRDLDYLRERAIPDLGRTQADFAFVLGDLVYDDLGLLPRYDRLMAQVGIPLWNLVGNHDLNYDAPSERHTRATFRSRYGANYYSFEYGETVFVALDNTLFQGLSDSGKPQYRGRIGEEQLEWLENLLGEIETDRLLVVATHIPLFAWDGEMPFANTDDRDRLFALLDGRRVLTLAGHLHMTYHHDLSQELNLEGFETFPHLIASTLSGSWWLGPTDPGGIPSATQRDGTPNGFHLLHFEGGSYREEYRALGHPKDHQVRWEWPEPVWHDAPPERPGQPAAPERLPLGELTELPQEWEGKVVVNVFSGAGSYSVELSVNQGPPVKMERTDGPSPYFTSLLARHPGAFGPSQALPTNHLWACDEPAELSLPGPHTVCVTVRDGERVVGRLTRVVEGRAQ